MDDILKDGKEMVAQAKRLMDDDRVDILGRYEVEIVEALIAEIERLRAELGLREQVVRDLGERSI